MAVLICQVLVGQPEISAANDLCGCDDGGTFCLVSEIRGSKVNGAFVARVAVVCWFAELVDSGLDLRANLVSVRDTEPVVEFVGSLAGASESKEVVKARWLRDDRSAVGWWHSKLFVL